MRVTLYLAVCDARGPLTDLSWLRELDSSRFIAGDSFVSYRSDDVTGFSLSPEERLD